MGILAANTVALIAWALTVSMIAGNADGQGATLSCLSKLTPCQKYLNLSKPPDECCRPLKDAVQNDQPCLCNVFQNPQVLGALGIDSNQARQLPVKCGIISSSTNLCSSIAAGSPAGSVVPPGASSPTPGNGSGGANVSMLWTLLILFFASFSLLSS